MEKLRSEVYLECVAGNMSRVDVFSHVKNAWVYDSVINSGDLLNLFEDLMIKPDSTIIHLSDDHPLRGKMIAGKFVTNEFNGLTGRYKTSDDSEYEIKYKPAKSPKSSRDLIARCVTSVTKSGDPFAADPSNIEKNIRHLLWIKIE